MQFCGNYRCSSWFIAASVSVSRWGRVGKICLSESSRALDAVSIGPLIPGTMDRTSKSSLNSSLYGDWQLKQPYNAAVLFDILLSQISSQVYPDYCLFRSWVHESLESGM